MSLICVRPPSCAERHLNSYDVALLQVLVSCSSSVDQYALIPCDCFTLRIIPPPTPLSDIVRSFLFKARIRYPCVAGRVAASPW
jgi:hypothetical protein